MSSKSYFNRFVAVRKKNSLKNVNRCLASLVKTGHGRPENIQVNVDTGNGNVFRINDIRMSDDDYSVHIDIDLSKPMNGPEFWPPVEEITKFKTDSDE